MVHRLCADNCTHSLYSVKYKTLAWWREKKKKTHTLNLKKSLLLVGEEKVTCTRASNAEYEKTLVINHCAAKKGGKKVS